MEYIRGQKDECLITSAAMIFGVSVHDLKDAIGHDGTGDHLGYHMQEIIDYAYERDTAIIKIEAYPGAKRYEQPYSKGHPLWSEEYCAKRVKNYLDNTRCIIECLNSNNQYHAVVNAYGTILDPAGMSTKIDDLTIINLWVIN